jgi:hypothetical protein
MTSFVKKWHWTTKLIVSISAVIIVYILFFEDQSFLKNNITEIDAHTYFLDSLDETPATSSVRDPVPPTLPSLDNFIAMIERPLFSPTRRNVESETITDAIQTTEPPPFPLVRFIGTIDKGQTIKALTDGPQGLRTLSVGDQFEEWFVLVVERRRMIFVRDGEYLELKILDRSS